MKTTQMEQMEAVYSEVACVAKGSATITCVGQRLQGRWGAGKLESEKGEASSVLWLEAVATRDLEAS